MLFEQRLWAGLADGTVTVTFRRWRRPRARVGARHRTPAGILAVDAVTEVDPAAIGETDARAAGFASLAEPPGGSGTRSRPTCACSRSLG
jgi:hypothetical protein